MNDEQIYWIATLVMIGLGAGLMYIQNIGGIALVGTGIFMVYMKIRGNHK